MCIKKYLRFVDLLTAIGHLIANNSPDVLNDHGVLLQILCSIQPQPLNARSCEVNVVLPLCLQTAVLRGLGVDELLAVWRVELSGEGTLVGL